MKNSVVSSHTSQDGYYQKDKRKKIVGKYVEKGKLYAPLVRMKPLWKTACCAVLSHSVVSDCLRPHGMQPTRLLCPWRFSRQEHWSGLPFPPPGDLSNPGTEPRSPELPADSLPSEPPGKPIFIWWLLIFHLYYEKGCSGLWREMPPPQWP